MNFCTITPTRGDRTELLANCKRQLARMNTRPTASFFIDYPPRQPGHPDLTERIMEGVKRAQAAGFDWVFIVEDDDYYPADYFDLDLGHLSSKGAKFIGEYSTIYYNLRNKTYMRWQHPRHSSLFTTGFRISALQDFGWPAGDHVFLDVTLWKYIVNLTKNLPGKHIRETGAVGIKHGIGLCGGKGHRQRNNNEDTVQMHWLREHTDAESFKFYHKLTQTL